MSEEDCLSLCLPTPRRVLVASQMVSVRSLQEALSLYGFKQGDHVPHRELVNIYKTVAGAMETELARITAECKYDKACEYRDTLRQLQAEFEDFQKETERERQAGEREQFQKASKVIYRQAEEEKLTRLRQTEEECVEEERELRKTHAFQREKLEKELSRLPEPTLKPTPLLLELKNSEAQLSAQRFYEEAKAVYRRREVLERQEIASAKKEFEDVKAKRRQRLLQRQDEEVKQLAERLKNQKLKKHREVHLESQRWTHTVKHLNEDMEHTHKVKLNVPPEYTVNKVFSEREHAKETSSDYLGQRMNSKVGRGLKGVTSLCALSEAEGRPPEGTIVYE